MSKNVLVVSANQSLSFILRSVFSHKFNCIVVPDASAALDILSRRSFDAVVVDVDYHTDDTLEFIHYISTSCIHCAPIAVLSSDQEISSQIEETEEILFFHKPFNPVNILSGVEELLINAVAASQD